MNDITLINETVVSIREMVEASVQYQVKVTPIYTAISDKILDMLNKNEELSSWEAKDLLKLLDLANKAQLQPIEQLTKLVQSVESLYDRSELQNKIDKVTALVEEIKEKSDASEHFESKPAYIEEIRPVE